MLFKNLESCLRHIKYNENYIYKILYVFKKNLGMEEL